MIAPFEGVPFFLKAKIIYEPFCSSFLFSGISIINSSFLVFINFKDLNLGSDP